MRLLNRSVFCFVKCVVVSKNMCLRQRSMLLAKVLVIGRSFFGCLLECMLFAEVCCGRHKCVLV